MNVEKIKELKRKALKLAMGRSRKATTKDTEEVERESGREEEKRHVLSPSF